MLLMFGVGAYLVAGYEVVAVALGGTIAVLLQFKPELHAFARRMGDKDFKAIMQFVLISLVILPVLPNQAYGPYHVLNPFKIWLLVALIVGMRLGGYIVYKWVGAKAGTVLSGVLGGLISSTATTVSYARHAREAPETSSIAALIIMVASTVLNLRIIIIVGIVAPSLFWALAGPLGAMLGAASVVTGGLWLLTRKETVAVPEQENPSELKPALIFALVFALVQLGVSAVKQYFGSQGLYALAFVSGLPDVDAITLSTLEMARRMQLDPEVAWRMILLASLANIVSKAAIIAVVGNKKLLARIAVPLSLTLIAGGLIFWLWP
ncbi:MAG: MgtC family protein, partial [Nevskia sp.]|nr:MgtC family protein [Nevskia sp.]